MLWEKYTLSEYFKLGFQHFGLAYAALAFYILGLKFSEGSNGDIEVPYFISGLVLFATQFTLGAMVLVIYCTTQSCPSESNKNKIDGLNSIYRLGIMIVMVWCVVGMFLTGLSGTCADFAKCYYTVNMTTNLWIAIALIVIHFISLVFLFFLTSKTRTIEREIEMLGQQDDDPSAPYGKVVPGQKIHPVRTGSINKGHKVSRMASLKRADSNTTQSSMASRGQSRATSSISRRTIDFAREMGEVALDVISTNSIRDDISIRRPAPSYRNPKLKNAETGRPFHLSPFPATPTSKRVGNINAGTSLPVHDPAPV